MSGKYDDIIDLPHPKSSTRPHMTSLQRAAQFSSFAALRGYDDVIAETARETEREIELTEERRTELGELLFSLATGDEASVTYFLPDNKKAGGVYLTRVGTLKKIDDIAQKLNFSDGTAIPFSCILSLTRLG